MNKDQTLTLPSGVEIPFRVVRPDDAPALQRLHARCSERTIYLRFFGPMKNLSDEQARYFASTDGVITSAWLLSIPKTQRRSSPSYATLANQVTNEPSTLRSS